ncbi:hypothetical protein, partial [Burkholderia vietnamiensis]|uniref:hypothetical protein n=1 Tax=Burkholderia vietnamiensis TaxID=60552 RepID=UPI0012D9F7B2
MRSGAERTTLHGASLAVVRIGDPVPWPRAATHGNAHCARRDEMPLLLRACEFVRRPGAPRLRGGSAGDHAHAPVRAFSMHATERELMISQSIFKAYDIRGVVGKTLDA